MRIYLDTSIINGLYTNDERIRDITKDFFRTAKFSHFTLYGSELVAVEIKNTPNSEKRELLIDVIEEYAVQILPITDEIKTLANCYIENKIIPVKYMPDALHIACCAVHNIPILLSWNFKHIVKHKTRVEVSQINEQFGFPQIDLCSPEEV